MTELELCIRCDNPGAIGHITGLCSPCWWKVAAWPDCRLNLTEDEEAILRSEKEQYGIRDIR